MHKEIPNRGLTCTQIVGDSPYRITKLKPGLQPSGYIKALIAKTQNLHASQMPRLPCHVAQKTPSIPSVALTGHNGTGSDVPYLAYQYTLSVAVSIYSSSISNDRRPQGLRLSLTSIRQSRVRLLISMAITCVQARSYQKHHVSPQYVSSKQEAGHCSSPLPHIYSLAAVLKHCYASYLV
jgi:hypothetical protein